MHWIRIVALGQFWGLPSDLVVIQLYRGIESARTSSSIAPSHNDNARAGGVMNRSQFCCLAYHAVLAIKNHSGRLQAEPREVVVLLPPDRAELTCAFGIRRFVDLPGFTAKIA